MVVNLGGTGGDMNKLLFVVAWMGFVLLLNLAVLAGAVYVIVKVLQWTGVLA